MLTSEKFYILAKDEYGCKNKTIVIIIAVVMLLVFPGVVKAGGMQGLTSPMFEDKLFPGTGDSTFPTLEENNSQLSILDPMFPDLFEPFEPDLREHNGIGPDPLQPIQHMDDLYPGWNEPSNAPSDPIITPPVESTPVPGTSTPSPGTSTPSPGTSTPDENTNQSSGQKSQQASSSTTYDDTESSSDGYLFFDDFEPIDYFSEDPEVLESSTVTELSSAETVDLETLSKDGKSSSSLSWWLQLGGGLLIGAVLMGGLIGIFFMLRSFTRK